MGACTLSPRPSFLIRLFPFKALVYNAINSSIDSMRGKHDTFGSMSAGALTGALYKSTGRKFSSQIISSLIAFVSWSQTDDCRCDYRVCSSRHLEYYKKECLIPLIQFIILSISSLLLSWHLWVILEADIPITFVRRALGFHVSGLPDWPPDIAYRSDYRSDIFRTLDILSSRRGSYPFSESIYQYVLPFILVVIFQC